MILSTFSAKRRKESDGNGVLHDVSVFGQLISKAGFILKTADKPNQISEYILFHLLWKMPFSVYKYNQPCVTSLCFRTLYKYSQPCVICVSELCINIISIVPVFKTCINKISLVSSLFQNSVYKYNQPCAVYVSECDQVVFQKNLTKAIKRDANFQVSMPSITGKERTIIIFNTDFVLFFL